MKFHIHQQEAAPEAARETLRSIATAYGFVPNLAGVFAESPAALNGLTGLMGAYDAEEMTLTPLERQVVLLTVSSKNRCEYCSAAHGMLAHLNGLDRTAVERIQLGEGSLGDTRLEALRRFAEAVVENRGRVSDAQMEDFLAAGFTQAQILETLLGVTLKTLTNYVYHVTKPPVNEQFAEFLPRWAPAA